MSSEKWLKERRRDPYYRKAKKEGYRSRAAFKLKQLDKRFGIFKDSLKVLDLGAAPGGWTQVASELIDEDGLVLGVDLNEIEHLNLPNVRTLVGDVRKEETQIEISRILCGKADVILSDMAPDVSGVWDMDHSKQIYLARVALKISDTMLKSDGWFVVKTFEGSEHPQFVRDVKNMFKWIRIVKPRASRKSSAENYVVARHLKERRILPEEFRKDRD